LLFVEAEDCGSSDWQFIAVYVADRDGLGWAINDRRAIPPLLINSLTLVEFTLEFFRFVYQQLVPLASRGQWTFAVHGHRLQTGEVGLGPGAPHRLGFALNGANATSDDFLSTFEGQGDPEFDAFTALSHIYGLWGLGEDAIPFAGDGRVLGDEVANA
jgi:hypothetical protein